MKKSTAGAVLKTLDKTYPDAKCALDFDGPLQLLVATILSAQCTDERVNMVTPGLFLKYPTAEKIARAPQKALEKIIHSCGFYRQKAKSIRACCRAIVECHGGKVPRRLEDLVELAGVGRKTANVVLNEAFGQPAIAVDTHVLRTSNRLGWISTRDPVKAEFQIMEAVPKKWWHRFTMLMIHHGRNCCSARKPKCPACP
ncbi:endonuclease III, partial [Nitrospinota bacterium]